MTGRPEAAPQPAPAGAPRGRRTILAVAAVAALVVVGAGLAVVIGGGAAPTPSPAVGEATPAWADLSLVPVTETSTPAGAPATPTGSPSGPLLPSASPGASESSVAGTKARRIRIDRLDIDLRIVEGDGVDAPIGKAAHYPGSAWPGDGSNIYIYGHARKGMFLSLWKAEVGDVVQLDLVDGTTREYVVAEVLPKVPWDAVKYTRPTETEQLTLQTSTSYYATAPRFIVIAYPAP